MLGKMVLTRLNILAVFCVFWAGHVVAQVSLYIPGVDPQALSATALGVGPGGRTTWEIHPGVTSGDYDQVTFSGTATLIEGPADARLFYVDAANGYSIDEGCVFSSSVARCRAAVLTDTVVTTSFRATETISPFLVQGGGAPPSSSSPTTFAISTPTPSSTASSGESATPSVAGQLANGGVGRLIPTSVLALVVLAVLGSLWAL